VTNKKPLAGLVSLGNVIRTDAVIVPVFVSLFVCVMVIETPLIREAIHGNGFLTVWANAVLWSAALLAIYAALLGSLVGRGGSQNLGGNLFPFVGRLDMNPAVKMDAQHSHAVSAGDFNFSHCHNPLHRHYDTERVMKTTNSTAFFAGPCPFVCLWVFMTYLVFSPRLRHHSYVFFAKRNTPVVSNYRPATHDSFGVEVNGIKTRWDFVASATMRAKPQTREVHITVGAVENMPRQAFVKHGFVVAITEFQLRFHRFISFLMCLDCKPNVGLLSRVNRKPVWSLA
jgi:hypothetical protein